MANDGLWTEVEFEVIITEKAKLVIEVTEPFNPDSIESMIRAARLTAELKQPEIQSNPLVMKIDKVNVVIPQVVGLFPDDGNGRPDIYCPLIKKPGKLDGPERTNR